MGENYYEILGVPETADEDTIKRAYRDLAKKVSPRSKPKYRSKRKNAAIK